MSSFSQRRRSRTGVSGVVGSGRSSVGGLVAGHVEQRRLAADPVALRGLAGREGVVQAHQDLRRVAQDVERADLGQRLEHLAVDEAQVDPRAEVRQRAELAALLARRDDRLDRALADVLDRQQAEPDRVALDREAEPGPVDVRRPDLDAQAPALGDGGGHLLGVVPEGRQHGRHVLDRVVRLEVRGLVGDQPVAGGVGLVEPVALERLERLEHRVDRLGRHAALGRPLDEGLLHRLQDRRASSCGSRSPACPPPAP